MGPQQGNTWDVQVSSPGINPFSFTDCLPFESVSFLPDPIRAAVSGKIIHRAEP